MELEFVIKTLTEADKERLIICKDWNDFFAHGFYGQYHKVEGNESVPTIYYNDARTGVMKPFVLKEDYDKFLEESTKNAEKVIKDTASKKKKK